MRAQAEEAERRTFALALALGMAWRAENQADRESRLAGAGCWATTERNSGWAFGALAHAAPVAACPNEAVRHVAAIPRPGRVTPWAHTNPAVTAGFVREGEGVLGERWDGRG
jgi:hypothetical protein